MKLFSTRYIYIACSVLCVCILQACNPEIDSDINLGNLQIEQYIALGDGYAAGFSNNALYQDVQQVSYPKLFSDQLSTVRTLNFKQPLLDKNGTGYQSLIQVISSECPEGAPKAVIETTPSDGSLDQNISDKGPFHNLGIPGLQLSDFADSDFSSDNSFLQRIITPGQPTSYHQLISANPSNFYTIWIGTESILRYAETGSQLNNDILSSDQYKDLLQNLIDSLVSYKNNVTILVGNIPDVTTFPYFASTSHMYVRGSNCLSSPLFIEAHNTNGELNIREASQNDLILLSADSLIGKQIDGNGSWGLSSEYAIEDQWVVDAYEVQEIQTFIEGYNLAIQQLVRGYSEQSGINLISVDLHNYFRNITLSGITVDGLDISGEYLSGGIFSLDGKYLTPRGNSYVTNIFIEAVNKNFNAKVPKVNISDFEGVIFP